MDEEFRLISLDVAMVTGAFVIFLLALGFARWGRRRHLGELTAEQKAAVTDATSADAVWPIVALLVIIHFPPRFAFASFSLSHQVAGAIAVLVACVIG